MFKIGQVLQKLNNRSLHSYKILGYASLRLGKIHEGNSFFEQATFIEKNLELVESSDAAQEALTKKAFK
ncbi:MAG: hypothetical protein ACE5HO_21850 [bacterium]